MIGRRITRKTALVCSSTSVLVILLGYTWLSHEQHKKNPDDRTIPTWSQLMEGVVFLFQKPDTQDEEDLLAAGLRNLGMEEEVEKEEAGFLEGRIVWEASKETLGRLFAGLSVGLIGGVTAGVLMGCFLKVDAAISPIMYFASRIIPTAALPLFFKMSGIGFEMYVAIISFGSMPIVTLTVSKYVQDFPEELLFKAYTLGGGHAEVITKAIFPYILPKILDLIILMIGPALVYLIAAEQIVAGEGFGYRIRVLTKATRFEVVYPMIVLLTVYAAALTLGLRFLQRVLCPWYNKGRR